MHESIWKASHGCTPPPVILSNLSSINYTVVEKVELMRSQKILFQAAAL